MILWLSCAFISIHISAVAVAEPFILNDRGDRGMWRKLWTQRTLFNLRDMPSIHGIPSYSILHWTGTKLSVMCVVSDIDATDMCQDMGWRSGTGGTEILRGLWLRPPLMLRSSSHHGSIATLNWSISLTENMTHQNSILNQWRVRHGNSKSAIIECSPHKNGFTLEWALSCTRNGDER